MKFLNTAISLVALLCPVVSLSADGSNEVLGTNAGSSLTTGIYNVVIGDDAGKALTSGQYNTVVGNSSLSNATTGGCNSTFGYRAGLMTSTGLLNTFLGYQSGFSNTTGKMNTFIGVQCGMEAEGSSNIAIGAFANSKASTHVLENYISIGSTANVKQSFGIALGCSTSVQGVKSVAIGHKANTSQANAFVIGDTAKINRLNVGIGTNTPNPASSLELAGSDRGLLINRLSSKQVTSFARTLNPTHKGLMIYDSTEMKLKIWNGSSWVNQRSSSVAPNLSVIEDSLAITEGTGVNLKKYLDNTDGQILGLTGTKITISGGNEIDLASLLASHKALIDQQAALIDQQAALISAITERVTAIETKLSTPILSPRTLTQNDGIFSATPIPANIETDEMVTLRIGKEYNSGSIKIFDATNNVVFSTFLTNGDREYLWDMTNQNGRVVAGGIYVAILTITDIHGTSVSYKTSIAIKQ